MGVEFVDKSGTPRDYAEIIEAKDEIQKGLVTMKPIPFVYYLIIYEALNELLVLRKRCAADAIVSRRKLMTCYIVIFETNSETSRDKVIEVLKAYGCYCPIHKYCWAIKTEEKAIQIRDKVQSILSATERVFVIRSGTEATWFNSYGEKHTTWLKKNL